MIFIETALHWREPERTIVGTSSIDQNKYVPNMSPLDLFIRYLTTQSTKNFLSWEGSVQSVRAMVIKLISHISLSQIFSKYF